MDEQDLKAASEELARTIAGVVNSRAIAERAEQEAAQAREAERDFAAKASVLINSLGGLLAGKPAAPIPTTAELKPVPVAPEQTVLAAMQTTNDEAAEYLAAKEYIPF